MRTPVYQALNRPKFIKGVDYRIFASLLTFGFGFVVFAKISPWFLLVLPVLLVFFIILRESNKKEPMLFQIYKRYTLQADAYDPWPVLKPKRGLRPLGFGQTKWLK